MNPILTVSQSIIYQKPGIFCPSARENGQGIGKIKEKSFSKLKQKINKMIWKFLLGVYNKKKRMI